MAVTPSISAASPPTASRCSGASWPHAAVWVPKELGVGLSVVSALTGRTRARIPGFVPWGTPITLSSDGRLLAVLAEGYERVEVREVATVAKGVAVKRAIGFHSTATLTPEVAQAQIRQHAKTAVQRRGEMKPYAVTRPVTLEVSMKNYRPVELLGYLPNVQRIDSHTVRFIGKDMIEVSKFIEFLTSYDPTLTP